MMFPFIYKKINGQYIVWLQKANMYFMLEEPAWFVFERLANQSDVNRLAVEMADKHGYTAIDCEVFIADMNAKLYEIEMLQKCDDGKLNLNSMSGISYQASSTYFYQLGSHVVCFEFEHEWLEDYIHPLIAHLMVDEPISTNLVFELFFYEKQVVFKFNGEVKGSWRADESHLTKGMIFLELINVLHGKTSHDWLMTVHASAITNGKKTILFSAAPGSGKTTMAALLQNEGYHLISDDFVPFDLNSTNAYPFPIAMSVKEGSLALLKDFYPDLEKKTINFITPEKKVRYWPIENEKMDLILPAKDLVFIQYDRSVDFEFEKMGQMQGIALLLDQIWVPPNPDNVGVLFDRIEKFSFYKLRYSDNSKAIKAIKQLFGEE